MRSHFSGGSISNNLLYFIIVLENGVAQVDVPCSGLKSLGTGTLFLLAATSMEDRKLGGRWLLGERLKLILSGLCQYNPRSALGGEPFKLSL